jgi:hypothetical protein
LSLPKMGGGGLVLIVSWIDDNLIIRSKKVVEKNQERQHGKI